MSAGTGSTILGTPLGLARSGLAAGLAAAVATTALAATARAAGVDFEVDGQAIPLSAFPWWTLIGAVAGIVAAKVVGDRRRFLTVAVAATALSLVPAIALPDAVATSVALVAAHLVAATIVVPALAHRKD
jgi:hypothetical protein